MQYQVIRSLSLDELVRLVNEAIMEGWKPLGGIGSVSSGMPVQAMIKE